MNQYPNYGPRRPVVVARPYSPWTSGLIGFGIDYACQFVILWVLGMLGLAVAIGAGLAGAPTPSVARVMVWIATAMLFAVLVGSVVTGMFLLRQGAHRPFTAALSGGFGGAVATQLGNLLPVSYLGFLLGAAVEVTLIATLSRHPDR